MSGAERTRERTSEWPSTLRLYSSIIRLTGGGGSSRVGGLLPPPAARHGVVEAHVVGHAAFDVAGGQLAQFRRRGDEVPDEGLDAVVAVVALGAVEQHRPSYVLDLLQRDATPESGVEGEREGKKKLDAKRQYMVIGTLALLLILLCDFYCEQGSGPGGDRRG